MAIFPLPLLNLTSPSCSSTPRPRFPSRRGNFGESAVKKGYIAYFSIAHARNGRISTSGLKSDVTVVFLDPHFCKDAKISAICVHLSQMSTSPSSMTLAEQVQPDKLVVLDGEYARRWSQKGRKCERRHTSLSHPRPASLTDKLAGIHCMSERSQLVM